MAAPEDEVVRAISGGGVAVRAMVGTKLVDEAVARHGLSPVASVALGRALMGAALLAAGAEDGESVQLHFSGDGPLGGVTVIADGAGRVRGTVGNPGATPPLHDGAFDVAAGIGEGLLAVVRERPGWKSPHRGVVPLATGTVAQDIAHYLERSEQTRSAVALGVFLTRDGRVEAAGGFFVSALPGASESEIAQVEANVRGFPGPGELVRAGLGAAEIVQHLLASLGSGPFERSRPTFHCPCERQRALRTIALLGRAELSRSTARGEALEVRCQFCGERYEISDDEIGSLLPDA